MPRRSLLILCTTLLFVRTTKSHHCKQSISNCMATISINPEKRTKIQSVITRNNTSKFECAFSFPSPRSLIKKRRAPIPISEEIGTSPTFQYELFDPIEFATEGNFAEFREAELKHGRIAMLAVVGNVVPDLYRNNVVPPHQFLISPTKSLAFDDVPCGLKALRIIPPIGWFQIVAFIGILETLVFVQRSWKDMPGDYGIGYFGLRDKGRHERSLRSELENGRLAMIAFLIQVIAELVTGKAPMEFYGNVMEWK